MPLTSHLSVMLLFTVISLQVDRSSCFDMDDVSLLQHWIQRKETRKEGSAAQTAPQLLREGWQWLQHPDQPPHMPVGAPGPFQKVLLVILNVHPERVPVLDAIYRPHFWDIVYVGGPSLRPDSMDPMSDSMGNSSEQVQNMEAHGVAFDACEEGNSLEKDTTYPCVGRLLSYLSKGGEGHSVDDPVPTEPKFVRQMRQDLRGELKGALMLHSDFWVLPSFGSLLYLDQPWYLFGGPSKMYPCATTDGKWCCDRRVAKNSMERSHIYGNVTWWNSTQQELRDAAVGALFQEFGQLPPNSVAATSKILWCHTWADLYYVPRLAWPTWSRAVSVIGRQRLLQSGITALLSNEHAIPLAMDVVMDFGHCTGAGGCKLGAVMCEGGPLINFKDAANLTQGRFPCGHKMDLRSENLRKGLMEIWSWPSFRFVPH